MEYTSDLQGWQIIPQPSQCIVSHKLIQKTSNNASTIILFLWRYQRRTLIIPTQKLRLCTTTLLELTSKWNPLYILSHAIFSYNWLEWHSPLTSWFLLKHLNSMYQTHAVSFHHLVFYIENMSNFEIFIIVYQIGYSKPGQYHCMQGWTLKLASVCASVHVHACGKYTEEVIIDRTLCLYRRLRSVYWRSNVNIIDM